MNIKLLIIFSLIFVLLDVTWISYFSNYIIPMIENIQNEKVIFNNFGAIMAYIIMIIVYWNIAFDNNYKPNYVASALLGLGIYGTYEFTNYATINKWKNNNILLMDIGWGMINSVLSLYLTTIIYNKLN
jgi:uncharacterized membrane protein